MVPGSPNREEDQLMEEALLKRVLFALAFVVAASVAAQAQGIKRSVLQKTDVPGSNYESVLGLAEVPAGVAIGLHTHPGTEQGTLLEGEILLSIEGQPDKTLKPGDSWTVPANMPHDAKAGSAGAKVIAVYIVEKGKPLASAFKK
jgi:quercetin dioxygenase-like cupin family protein